MIAAIVGSRNGMNWTDVRREIIHLLSRGRISEVVSGGAIGVDQMAFDIAQRLRLPTTTVLPEWKKYGKSAGFRRNVQIVDYSDVVFAFWNGVSKGTKHTIDIARRANKPVKIWTNGTWT